MICLQVPPGWRSRKRRVSLRSSRQPDHLRNETRRRGNSSDELRWRVGRAKFHRRVLQGRCAYRAGWGSERVFVEDGRVLDRGLKMIDQVVDDLELASGAVVAREAAEQWFNEVVDEAGEDAGRFGWVELLDFVAPAFSADLFQRRFEAAGYELFVEACGAGWCH